MNDFYKINELNPNHIKVYGSIGNVNFSLNKYEEAIKNYNNVLKLNPHDANAYFSIAACYKKLNQTKKMNINLKKALQLDPEIKNKDYYKENFAK